MPHLGWAKALGKVDDEEFSGEILDFKLVVVCFGSTL
jgi:hypothetical protein